MKDLNLKWLFIAIAVWTVSMSATKIMSEHKEIEMAKIEASK